MSRPTQSTLISHPSPNSPAATPRGGAGEQQGAAMKKGWQMKTLGELCEIKPPKSEARERVAASALVSFAPMEDLGIDRKFLNASQTKPLASVVGSYTYFADGDVHPQDC